MKYEGDAMSRFWMLLILGGLLQGPLQAQSASNWRANSLTGASASVAKPDDTLPDLLPSPHGKTTLLGGVIRTVDPVRDQLNLQTFGGGKMIILFDGRTHVYRDGQTASLQELKSGDRIYADTALAGNDIFAKNVRIVSADRSGEGNGQIVSYEKADGELLLRDTLSPEPAKLHVASNVSILCKDISCSASDLRSGALVSLVFHPDKDGHPLVTEITIFAAPGAAFSFVGRVVHIDLHANLLVVVDPRDNKSYDIHLQPGLARLNDLHEGADVTITTAFDGTVYTANAITIHPPVAK
jgi:hypothetical protein